jgi:hypothetical protein
LKELLAAAGKTPAEGWGSSDDPRNQLVVALNPDCDRAKIKEQSLNKLNDEAVEKAEKQL